jgi:hypothetical protein
MRRGRIIGGTAILLAAAALSAPYAFGAAVDQGYPCATTPPAAPGSTGAGAGMCTTTTTVTTTVTTTTPAAPPSGPVQAPAPAQNTGGQNVAGASHTVHRAAQPTAAGVAPATHATGTLPFTGAQLTTFVVLGLLLVAGGLVLRISGRSRTDG